MNATIINAGRFFKQATMLVAFLFLLVPVAAATDSATADSASVTETTNDIAVNNTTGMADANQTAYEGCRAACNRDYEVCLDEGMASDSSMNGRPSAGFGRRHCDGRLTQCTTGCRGL